MKCPVRVSLVAAMASILAVSISPWCYAQYSSSDSQVGLPRFKFKDGNTYNAGKMFAIQWTHGQKLLLCPIHLLGPAGGVSYQLAAQEIPNKLSSIEVFDLKQASVIASGGRSLLGTKADPRAIPSSDCTQDLAAFEMLSNPHLSVLQLAPSLAPVGTKIWVLSKDNSSNSLQADRYPGSVMISQPNALTLKLDKSLTAMGSSGAPVVNEKNQVVGMLVGSGGDRKMALATSSVAIYNRLSKELP